MKDLTRLEILTQHYMHRRIGNTTFMLTGVTYSLPAVIVFANIRQATVEFNEASTHQYPDNINRAELRIGRVVFRSIDDLSSGRHHEWRGPVMVDHFAFMQLFDEHNNAKAAEKDAAVKKAELDLLDELEGVLESSGHDYDWALSTFIKTARKDIKKRQ